MLVCPKKFLRKSSTVTAVLGSANFHKGEDMLKKDLERARDLLTQVMFTLTDIEDQGITLEGVDLNDLLKINIKISRKLWTLENEEKLNKTGW